MPTYEFHCESCEAYGTGEFSIHEDAQMRCPRCHTLMSKIYSAPGLIFKGSGWGGK
jgi:putative FmdB family regulatory protein